MNEEEYLRFEEKAAIRHEFVGGHVFAMTGSTDAHNFICGNIFAQIHASLRGGKCRAYMNDMKVRIQIASSYYYPDIMVSCEGFQSKSVFKEQPVLLVEVLSPSTKQIDLREKLVAYQKITTLKEYVIVHQDRQQIDVHRRVDGESWEFETLSREQDLQLHSLPNGVFAMSFDTIYGDYNPPSRVKEDEESYDFEMVDA
jgi:Uma2 family endonuclease